MILGRQTRHGRAALALVLALVALLLSSTSAFAATRLTKPGYQAKANAICAAENKSIEALPSGLSLAQYLTKGLGIARVAFDQLKTLQPPASFASLHSRLIANIGAGFPIVQALIKRAAVHKLTVAQFQADKALRANATTENALWKQLGAKTCSSA